MKIEMLEVDRLVFLALAGLYDLAVTLAAPATLILVAEVHEHCLGEPPPSSLFAFGMIAQGVHNTQVNGSKLVITKSDDSTTLGERTITTDATALPITGLDSD